MQNPQFNHERMFTNSEFDLPCMIYKNRVISSSMRNFAAIWNLWEVASSSEAVSSILSQISDALSEPPRYALFVYSPLGHAENSTTSAMVELHISSCHCHRLINSVRQTCRFWMPQWVDGGWERLRELGMVDGTCFHVSLEDPFWKIVQPCSSRRSPWYTTRNLLKVTEEIYFGYNFSYS